MSVVEATSPNPLTVAQGFLRMVGSIAKIQASEAALLASFAGSAPIRLALAKQGRRTHSRSTQGHTTVRPVLLVHGFGGTKSSWTLVTQELIRSGFTVEAIAYTPFGTSVRRLADQVVADAHRLLHRSGADKVHLIGHSLGGVVIAEAISGGRLDGMVDTVVTLGSPFGGSPWATLLPVGEVARTLRGGSPLLRRLNSSLSPTGVRWLAFTAAHDIVVPGLRSVPAHGPVEVVTIGSVGHLGLLVSRHVIDGIVDALLDRRIEQAESA